MWYIEEIRLTNIHPYSTPPYTSRGGVYIHPTLFLFFIKNKILYYILLHTLSHLGLEERVKKIEVLSFLILPSPPLYTSRGGGLYTYIIILIKISYYNYITSYTPLLIPLQPPAGGYLYTSSISFYGTPPHAFGVGVGGVEVVIINSIRKGNFILIYKLILLLLPSSPPQYLRY